MDPSVLFSGLRFDQKRFGADLQRFKRNGRDISLAVGSSAVESNLDIATSASVNTDDSVELARSPESRLVSENVGVTGYSKEKKRKAMVDMPSAPPVFDIFKPPEPPTTESVRKEPVVSKKRKIVNQRMIEEAAILRKKFNLHVAGPSVPPPLVGFEQLKSQHQCERVLLRRIAKAGFKEPTPIQRQAIPVLLGRRECLACAPTGSGKTLAFMLPIIMNLKETSADGIRAVILCPIRELAAQTAREFHNLVSRKILRVRALTTSLFKTADFSTLPCDILISTPLRLEHLLKKRKIDLSKVEFLVMDESDKLFEMGFVEQIDSVVAACTNPKVVRALFSATLPDSVEELARTIMHDLIRIIVGEKNSAASTVNQKLVYVGSEDGKLLALRQMFKESLRPPILLFVQSKERAKELHRELVFGDIKVDSIHSDRTQEQREATVQMFREGRTWVLVATDLMARGMDFKGVNHVINYDFPQTVATYIHRIGRTGRAGRSGEAVTFYTEKDVPQLRSIAHIIRSAGCDVPDWMLALPKVKVKKRKKFVSSGTV